MDWYAVFVQTGKEEYFQKWIKLYFDKATLYSLVPKRKLPERKQGKVNHILKILFPGYVLIQTVMTPSIYSTFTAMPNFIRFLGNGTCYSKIDEREISPLLRLLDGHEILEYSGIYAENSTVVVKTGPLQGMEAIIHRVDKRKNRAKIMLNFLNSVKLIDVGIEVLAAPH